MLKTIKGIYVLSVKHIVSEDENYFLMLLYNSANVRMLLVCSLKLPPTVNVMLVPAGARGRKLV